MYKKLKILFALVSLIAFAYCSKDLANYKPRRYDNTYLYGDSVKTWYPYKIVRTHKKTVIIDTSLVYKPVAVFVNNSPDTVNYKIIFSKQNKYNFLVNYEMPDSMANLLRVPKKGEANLDEGNGSIEFERVYVSHQSGNPFNENIYTAYNKDSIVETEEVDLYFPSE
jgi:hypothetical protein